MIDLRPEQPEVKLWREVLFLLIEDYLKNIGSRIGERSKLFCEADDFIYGAKREYFNGLCMAADLSPSWVRRRLDAFLVRSKKEGFNWMYAASLAERVLGLCEFVDTIENYKKRGRKIKLVKNT